MQAEAEAAVRTRRQRWLEQKLRSDLVAIDRRTAEHRTTYEAYLKQRKQMHPNDVRRLASQFRVGFYPTLKHIGELSSVTFC